MPDTLFYVSLGLLLPLWLAVSVLRWRWNRRNLASLRAEQAAELAQAKKNDLAQG